MTSLYAAFVAVALTSAPAETPLTEFGQMYVGRWIGDITLVADWPALGTKGDKITGYMEARWIADGYAIEVQWLGGRGSAQEVIVWNPVTKTIDVHGVNTSGRVWQGDISKKGDDWAGKINGCLGDGTKFDLTAIISSKDDGKTLLFTSEENGNMGGEKMDPLHDVFTKLDTEPAADTPLQKFGESLAGRWVGDIELVRDWPGVGKKGDTIIEYATCEWAADHRVIQRKWHGGQGTGSAVLVWDPAEKKIRQFSVNSGGSSFNALVWQDGDQWRWTLEGALGDGTVQTGSGTVVFSDDGKTYDVVGTMVVGGEEVSFVDPYTRIDE